MGVLTHERKWAVAREAPHLGGSGAIPPRNILGFIQSEMVSAAISRQSRSQFPRDLSQYQGRIFVGFELPFADLLAFIVTSSVLDTQRLSDNPVRLQFARINIALGLV